MTRKEELLNYIEKHLNVGDILLLPKYKLDTLESIRNKIVVENKENLLDIIESKYNDNLVDSDNAKIIAWKTEVVQND
jgi:hypothetical protein